MSTFCDIDGIEEAVTYCSKCDMNFCELCDTGFHVKSKAKHIRRKLGESAEESQAAAPGTAAATLAAVTPTATPFPLPSSTPQSAADPSPSVTSPPASHTPVTSEESHAPTTAAAEETHAIAPPTTAAAEEPHAIATQPAVTAEETQATASPPSDQSSVTAAASSVPAQAEEGAVQEDVSSIRRDVRSPPSQMAVIEGTEMLEPLPPRTQQPRKTGSPPSSFASSAPDAIASETAPAEADDEEAPPIAPGSVSTGLMSGAAGSTTPAHPPVDSTPPGFVSVAPTVLSGFTPEGDSGVPLAPVSTGPTQQAPRVSNPSPRDDSDGGETEEEELEHVDDTWEEGDDEKLSYREMPRWNHRVDYLAAPKKARQFTTELDRARVWAGDKTLDLRDKAVLDRATQSLSDQQITKLRGELEMLIKTNCGLRESMLSLQDKVSKQLYEYDDAVATIKKLGDNIEMAIEEKLGAVQARDDLSKRPSQSYGPTPAWTGVFESEVDTIHHSFKAVEDDTVVAEGKGFLYTMGQGMWARITSSLRALDLVQVACGERHFAALSRDGQLFTWGDDSFGQLGLADPVLKEDDAPQPHVSLRMDTSARFIAVACGNLHTMAMTEQREVFTWGSNRFGQLGLHHSYPRVMHPTKVKDLDGKNIFQICCGSYHSAVLSTDGLVYTWGKGSEGALGHGEVSLDHKAPEVVASLMHLNIRWLACGGNHTACVTSTGEVYTWGFGALGQLGLGNRNSVRTPHLVESFVTFGKRIRSLSCGRSHTMCIADDRTLWAFGCGQSGQLGIHERSNSNESELSDEAFPREVLWAHHEDDQQLVPITSLRVREVACGPDYSIFLTDHGHVYSWGSSKGCNLAHGVPTMLLPRRLMGIDNVFYVACGYFDIGLISVLPETPQSDTVFFKSNRTGPVETAELDIREEFVNDLIEGNGYVWTWGKADNFRLGLQTTNKVETNPQFMDWLRFTNIMDLSLGNDSGVALTEEGEIWTWGDNTHGQLGRGNEKAQTYPAIVQYCRDPDLSRLKNTKNKVFVKVSAGRSHCLALTNKGKMFAWGKNKYGQLGLGNLENNFVPIQIRGPLEGVRVKSVVCGSQFSACISDKGALYTWGKGWKGQLGHGDFEFRGVPSLVEDLVGQVINVVSCGLHHTICLTDTANVYTWGSNTRGQLGLRRSLLPDSTRPVFVEELAGKDINVVVAGHEHCVAVNELSEVYAWGDNRNLQLGKPADVKDQELPELVPHLPTTKRIRTLYCGPNSTFAVSDIGEVFIFGFKDGGDYTPDFDVKGNPLPWQHASLDNVVMCAASDNHAACINIYRSGEIDAEPYEDSDNDTVFSATSVRTQTLDRALQVLDDQDAACEFNSDDEHIEEEIMRLQDDMDNLDATTREKMANLMTTKFEEWGKKPDHEEDDGVNDSNSQLGDPDAVEKGCIVLWGSNSHGQLGDGSVKTHHTPIYPEGVFKLAITFVACGENHTVVVANSDQQVYSWGAGESGQLGHENFKDQKTPKRVMGLHDKAITQVACGARHTICLADTGKMYAFGHNKAGQCGLGHYKQTHTPDIVFSLRSVHTAEIVCGANHSSALTDDGKLYIWGQNDYGQLGLGDVGNQCDPSQCPELEPMTIIGVALGMRHSMVLTDDDMVYVWGNNEFGQLGLNNQFSSKSPVLLDKLQNRGITVLRAGGLQSAAMCETGELFTWGASDYGQLGHGDFEMRLFPTLVKTIPDGVVFSDVVIGVRCTYAVTAESDGGHLYTWGENAKGRLSIPLQELEKCFVLNDCVLWPRKLPNLTGVVAMSGWGDHGCAVVLRSENNIKNFKRQLRRFAALDKPLDPTFEEPAEEAGEEEEVEEEAPPEDEEDEGPKPKANTDAPENYAPPDEGPTGKGPAHKSKKKHSAPPSVAGGGAGGGTVVAGGSDAGTVSRKMSLADKRRASLTGNMPPDDVFLMPSTEVSMLTPEGYSVGTPMPLNLPPGMPPPPPMTEIPLTADGVYVAQPVAHLAQHQRLFGEDESQRAETVFGEEEDEFKSQMTDELGKEEDGEMVFPSRRQAYHISQDVCSFINRLGLTKFVKRFWEHEVTFETLLLMTEDDLREIGIRTVGARKRIMAAILHLNNATFVVNGEVRTGTSVRSASTSLSRAGSQASTHTRTGSTTASSLLSTPVTSLSGGTQSFVSSKRSLQSSRRSASAKAAHT